MDNQSQPSSSIPLISQNQIPAGAIKERHLVATPTIANGDLLYGDGNNNFIRLPVSTDGYVLTLVDGVPAWVASTSSNTTAARAYLNTTNQTISNNTSTKIAFNAETFDKGSNFDSATNHRYVCLTAGQYQVNTAIRWNSSVDQSVHAISINKNGAAYSIIYGRSSGASYFYQAMGDILDCAAGDYIDVNAYQNTGGDVDVVASSTDTYMSVSKITGSAA